MSIIEKFKNVDKKNLIILVLSLLIVLLLVCAGIGLWQWNQYKADEMHGNEGSPQNGPALPRTWDESYARLHDRDLLRNFGGSPAIAGG